MTTTLGKVAEVYSGFAFKSSDLTDAGIPLIKIANIQEKEVSQKCNSFFPQELFSKNLEKYILQKGDILVAMTGAGSVGRIGKMYEVEKQYLVNQRVGIIRPNSKVIDSDFLFHILRQDQFEDRLYQLGLGAGQPNISPDNIRSLEIGELPDLSDQKKIASILSSFDNAILKNKKRIEILTTTTQIIFKEWFRNYKFPHYENVAFIDSGNPNFGLIPEEWSLQPLGKIATNFDKKRVPLSSIERSKKKGLYPYYGAASILDYIDDYLFDGRYLLMGEDGTVQTPGGYPMLQLVEGKFWVNNHAHVLRGTLVSTEYLYLSLIDYPIVGHITGVAQPKINQENMNRINILVPSENILKLFQEKITPAIDLTFNLNSQNLVISRIRDLLLPRLMSGEIVVPEVFDLSDKDLITKYSNLAAPERIRV